MLQKRMLRVLPCAFSVSFLSSRHHREKEITFTEKMTMIAATALRMDNAYPYKIHRPNRLKENNVRYFKKTLQHSRATNAFFLYSYM